MPQGIYESTLHLGTQCDCQTVPTVTQAGNAVAACGYWENGAVVNGDGDGMRTTALFFAEYISCISFWEKKNLKLVPRKSKDSGVRFLR